MTLDPDVVRRDICIVEANADLDTLLVYGDSDCTGRSINDLLLESTLHTLSEEGSRSASVDEDPSLYDISALDWAGQLTCMIVEPCTSDPHKIQPSGASTASIKDDSATSETPFSSARPGTYRKPTRSFSFIQNSPASSMRRASLDVWPSRKALVCYY